MIENPRVRTNNNFAMMKWLNSCKTTPGKKRMEKTVMVSWAFPPEATYSAAWISRCSTR
jgi:hypothetical protein